MQNLRSRNWSPYAVGVALGILSWIAFATAGRGLGITTAFEHTAALGVSTMSDGALPPVAYVAKETPKIGWEWMLVIGVFAGSLLSARLSGDRQAVTVPPMWKARFGSSVGLRLGAAFVAGAVMMFGARVAQGCTSGHGITGSLQLAMSSWIFITTAFGVAALVALLMYGREARHV